LRNIQQQRNAYSLASKHLLVEKDEISQDAVTVSPILHSFNPRRTFYDSFDDTRNDEADSSVGPRIGDSHEQITSGTQDTKTTQHLVSDPTAKTFRQNIEVTSHSGSSTPSRNGLCAVGPKSVSVKLQDARHKHNLISHPPKQGDLIGTFSFAAHA